MAINREDKADVAKAFGKGAANKIATATDDSKTKALSSKLRMSKKWPAQPAGYERHVRKSEREGMDRSDAQGVADVHFKKLGYK